MVVKQRRLSPSLLDSPVSMATSASSGSTDDNDRVLPLFSEHQQQQTNSVRSIRLGVPSRRVLIGEDDDDNSDNDTISTCSPSERQNGPQHAPVSYRHTSILRSGASSVASEPTRHRRRHPKGTRAMVMSSNDDSITFHSSAVPSEHFNQDFLPENDLSSSFRILHPASSTSSILKSKDTQQLPQHHPSTAAVAAAPTQSTFIFTARRRKSPLYFVMAAFCALGMFLYSQSHATLHDSLQQVLRLTEERRMIHAQFRRMETDLRALEGELAELTPKNPGEPSSSSSSSSSRRALDELRAVAGISPRAKSAGSEKQRLLNIQTNIDEDHSKIGNLQKHLQLISKRDAAAKYGHGIIRVELELDFPDEDKAGLPPSDPQPSKFKSSANVDKGDASIIILEMAPLDLMPHSVYMFLEMVHAQLFDGCSFILNALHVIKAAPLPYDGSSAAQKVKSFTRQGLESVAFREYSPEYPHVQHTVAFSADGSPSFYINTQDNSDMHIGEPCFGKVVAGFDTLQRLEEFPTRNGIWYKHRIGIKKARIL